MTIGRVDDVSAVGAILVANGRVRKARAVLKRCREDVGAAEMHKDMQFARCERQCWM
jgi:hypothetical protein